MSKGNINVVCEVKDYLPLEKILPHPDNPRSITDFRLQQLKEALTGTGLFKAFIVDEEGYCLAGNMRHQALVELKQEGWEIPADLPVVYYKGTEAKLVMLLDNNNFGYFDCDKVQGVLADIESELGEGKDLSITGFTPNEIQMYIAEDEEEDAGIQKFQDYEETDNKQAVLKNRDYSLWIVFQDRTQAEEVCEVFGLKMRANAFAQSFRYGEVFYQLVMNHKEEIKELVAAKAAEVEAIARANVEVSDVPPLPKKKQAGKTKLSKYAQYASAFDSAIKSPHISDAPPLLADEPQTLPID